MRFSHVAILLLLSITASNADQLATKVTALPLDLIELLGELDDADTATLDFAVSDIEAKKMTEQTTEKTVEKLTTTAKKSPTGGEK